jgi:hypothetical protein
LTIPVVPPGLVPSGLAPSGAAPEPAPPPTATLRPRTASEIVDVAVQLLRRQYAQFLTISAIWYVPILVLQLSFFRRVATEVATGRLPTEPLGSFGVFGFIALLWYVLMDATMVHAASDAYLGRSIDVEDCIRRAVPSIAAVFFALLIKFVMLGVGVLLFFVGYFYFLALFFVVPAAVVLERVGAFAGVARSVELSRGLKWHALRTIILVAIIYILLYMVAGAVGGLLFGLTHSQIWVQLITAVASVALYPLFPIVQTALYYDARIRKEGFSGVAQ